MINFFFLTSIMPLTFCVIICSWSFSLVIGPGFLWTPPIMSSVAWVISSIVWVSIYSFLQFLFIWSSSFGRRRTLSCQPDSDQRSKQHPQKEFGVLEEWHTLVNILPKMFSEIFWQTINFDRCQLKNICTCIKTQLLQ